MKSDDPSATYRGYRRQALYVLFRLFDSALAEDYSVQPEGVEDLAIFDNKTQLVEVVQVKDYTSSLVPSSFKPFFHDRISQLLAADSKVNLRIATFGPVGSDLLAAKQGEPLAKARVIQAITKALEVEWKKGEPANEKLQKSGLPVALATQIIDRIAFEQVS